MCIRDRYSVPACENRPRKPLVGELRTSLAALVACTQSSSVRSYCLTTAQLTTHTTITKPATTFGLCTEAYRNIWAKAKAPKMKPVNESNATVKKTKQAANITNIRRPVTFAVSRFNQKNRYRKKPASE